MSSVYLTLSHKPELPPRGQATSFIVAKAYSSGQAGEVLLTPPCSTFEDLSQAIDQLRTDLEEARTKGKQLFADIEAERAMSNQPLEIHRSKSFDDLHMLPPDDDEY